MCTRRSLSDIPAFLSCNWHLHPDEDKRKILRLIPKIHHRRYLSDAKQDQPKLLAYSRFIYAASQQQSLAFLTAHVWQSYGARNKAVL